MAEMTRRAFLRKTSAGMAAGVAAIGVIGGDPQAATASARPRAGTETSEALPSESIVAYIRGGERGEVRVLVGEREVVRRDPELFHRLLRAAK